MIKQNIAQPYRGQPKGKQLYKSMVRHQQYGSDVPAVLTSNMLLFGDQFVQYHYDIKFGVRENNIYFENQSDTLELQLPNDDSKQWQKILKKYLNQRGFHNLFKPIKKIGKGNFASVYLAEKLEDKVKYAVKSFSKQSAYSQQNGKQCLVKEIEIMRELNHHNIMNLEEVFESENSLYIIFELLDGGQLHDAIKKKQFSSPEIKDIMYGLLDGLKYMHAKRIMHRDLKPENILLRSKDSHGCVIADFGLAEFQDQQKYLFVRCGTPGYVAPQVLNVKNMEEKYKCACDIFSLGVIFHILIFGESIFDSKDYGELVAANKQCKFTFNEPKYEKIDAQTKDLLEKMLKVKPEERISASAALEHCYFKDIKKQGSQEAPKRFPFFNFTCKKQRIEMLKNKNSSLKMQKNNALMGNKETLKQNQDSKVSLMKNLQGKEKIVKISKFSKQKQ